MPEPERTTSYPSEPASRATVLAVMRGIALPVYLPSFFSAIAQNAMQIMLPLYALEIGGGPALAATVVGLRGAGTMLMDVPAGMLVTRIGDRGVMILGLVAATVATFMAAAATEVTLLSFAALGFGAGAGIWVLGRVTFITDTVRLDQRGRVISLMAGMQRAGAFVGPVIAGVGADLIGYRAVFVGAGVLWAVSLVIVMIFARSARPAEGLERSRLAHIVSTHKRTFATAGSVMVVLMFLRTGVRLMIPLVGAEMGFSAAEIGLAYSLSSAIDMAMFYPAGMIIDLAGRRWALGPAMLLLGIGVAALPFAGSFWAFTAAGLLAGLGNGFGTGIFMTLGGDLSPAQGRGEFLGVWRLVGDAGAAVGPFIMGPLAQWTSMAIACTSTGGMALVGIVLLIVFVPETLRRPPAITLASHEERQGRER